MTPPPTARPLPPPPAARRPTLVGVAAAGRARAPDAPSAPGADAAAARTAGRRAPGLRRSGMNLPPVNAPAAPPPPQPRMPTPMRAVAAAGEAAVQRAAGGAVRHRQLRRPSPSRRPARARGLRRCSRSRRSRSSAMVYWYNSNIKPGRIELTTTPGDATVLIDNVKVGDHSPVSIEKSPGPYTLSVTRDGYVRNDQNIELQGGPAAGADRRRWSRRPTPASS